MVLWRALHAAIPRRCHVHSLLVLVLLLLLLRSRMHLHHVVLLLLRLLSGMLLGHVRLHVVHTLHLRLHELLLVRMMLHLRLLLIALLLYIDRHLVLETCWCYHLVLVLLWLTLHRPLPSSTALACIHCALPQQMKQPLRVRATAAVRHLSLHPYSSRVLLLLGMVQCRLYLVVLLSLCVELRLLLLLLIEMHVCGSHCLHAARLHWVLHLVWLGDLASRCCLCLCMPYGWLGVPSACCCTLLCLSIWMPLRCGQLASRRLLLLYMLPLLLPLWVLLLLLLLLVMRMGLPPCSLLGPTWPALLSSTLLGFATSTLTTPTHAVVLSPTTSPTTITPMDRDIVLLLRPTARCR
jgi:hypothetical protein